MSLLVVLLLAVPGQQTTGSLAEPAFPLGVWIHPFGCRFSSPGIAFGAELLRTLALPWSLGSLTLCQSETSQSTPPRASASTRVPSCLSFHLHWSQSGGDPTFICYPF